MASQRIHGITIDLDVNTSGVSQAFSDINKSLSATSRELKSVDKLLKDDATNTTLLSQKQYLLADAIDKTQNKLIQLYKAKKQADETGDVDPKQYRELERDIARTKQSLEQLNEELKKNEQQTEQAVKPMEDFGNSLDGASEKGLKFGDIVKANVISDVIIGGLKLLASAMKEVAQEVIKFADDYRELEVYEKQFESNIRNTADATDEQIDSLKKLAKQKERSGVISKKAITSAYQELATYVESTDAIEGLTDALLDMSAQQYGVDATEESVRNIATTLGKALANGDYSGLTRLGYGFTELQERIMEYGTEAERVAVINDVISASIGGMNEALAETDAGKMFEFAHSFDEFKETIGALISEIQVEFLEGVAPLLTEMIGNLVTWIMENKDSLIEMVQNIVEWLTSDETKQFFYDVAELIGNLVEIGTQLLDIVDKIGLVEGALWALKAVLQIVLDLTNAIVSGIRYIKENGFTGFDLSANSSWGSDNPFIIGGMPHTRGFGGLMSGGFNSSGITVNASFTINESQMARNQLDLWGQELADAINNRLGMEV